MNHTTSRSVGGFARKTLFPKPPYRAYNSDETHRFGGPLAYFGPGYFEGTTTVAGNPNLPKSCPVRIYARDTGQFVREVRSSETGIYRVDNLKLGIDYTIIAIDESGQHNAVIADRLRAKP